MSVRLWSKVVVAYVLRVLLGVADSSSGLGVCIGGPALIWYVSPTEEELFKKYNPELQKRSLANRRQNQQDFEHFVSKLKEYSKSDRPIWEAAAADEAATRRATAMREAAIQQEEARQRRAGPGDAVERAIREEALRSR